MRGEYLPTKRLLDVHEGTTSACAENTSEKKAHSPSRGNYLRMRGEYFKPSRLMWSEGELPPHARRIRKNWPCIPRLSGTTSACAENTESAAFFLASARNYLRMRGEYLENMQLKGY